MMKAVRSSMLGLVSAGFLVAAPVQAQPAIWETAFGPPLAALTGQDDEVVSVTLSFPFPFEGDTYTTIWVGTNGDLQLGSLGDDADIDYDHWEYMDEFIADLAPSIAGLNTDLDLTSNGTVHFNEVGGRAIFTWNEVGTNENEDALISFQIQLGPDGTITLGYNGVLDGPGEDLVNDLDEGIVVGVSSGLWPDDQTEPGLTDLSAGAVTVSAHVYDRWCYDVANSCGFDGGSVTGLPGPINSAFDLDQSNVVFTPRVGGGFSVTFTAAATNAIPVMAPWGLALLCAVLGLFGAFSQRRRR